MTDLPLFFTVIALMVTTVYLILPIFRALCDMIAKHEQPPVDRKLLCAREAMARAAGSEVSERQWRDGSSDYMPSIQGIIRAIELWEEGFGK